MSKKEGEKLVVSLKSSSVEVSVVNFDKEIELLFYSKENMLFNRPLSSKEFVDQSFIFLKKLIKDNFIEIKKTLGRSRKCELIFHSPWFLPELISEELKGQKASLKKFFMAKVKPPDQKDYFQLENKITNIKLNGYQLTKLKDEISDDIEINIYRSFVSNLTIKRLGNEIRTILPQINKFGFSTSTMQMYETIKNLFINTDNCLLINIGGEVTEINIVIEDVLTDSVTIPMGAHAFSRKLDTFISTRGNLSTLSFLGNKSIDEKLDKIKNNKIEEVKKEWLENISSAINESKKELPKNVFVFTNSESVEFFELLFEDIKIFSENKIIFIKESIFNDRIMNIAKKQGKNIEYLLSSYYLSIKS